MQVAAKVASLAGKHMIATWGFRTWFYKPVVDIGL